MKVSNGHQFTCSKLIQSWCLLITKINLSPDHMWQHVTAYKACIIERACQGRVAESLPGKLWKEPKAASLHAGRHCCVKQLVNAVLRNPCQESFGKCLSQPAYTLVDIAV
jgi:hypothetical protein